MKKFLARELTFL